MPMAFRASSGRTETGTMAMSGPLEVLAAIVEVGVQRRRRTGRAPRRSPCSRARSTSLTRDSESVLSPKLRWGVSDALNEVFGAASNGIDGVMTVWLVA
ncbi:MAG: hypothetical protein U5R31_08385 [Acidimicrobiia bacterium]|nr:hypothetical protein [Acidimicrobiia bacterium]